MRWKCFLCRSYIQICALADLAERYLPVKVNCREQAHDYRRRKPDRTRYAADETGDRPDELPERRDNGRPQRLRRVLSRDDGLDDRVDAIVPAGGAVDGIFDRVDGLAH